MKATKREWATAYHEAGHAVINVWLGVRVRSASIVPDELDGTLGHVLRARSRIKFDDDYSRDHEWVVRRRLEPAIQVAYAGTIAERRFSGGRYNRVGAEDDLSWAADCLFRLEGGGKVTELYSRYLWAATERMVEARWEMITNVAAALMEHRTLKGSQIRPLMFPDPA